jgi:hypothetical protein
MVLVYPRRSTLPKGGPACARRAKGVWLATGRAIGGYVAQGLFAGSGFGLLMLHGSSRVAAASIVTLYGR